MFELPSGKYFISHSYGDGQVLNELKAQLPDDVTMYIFQKIKPSLDEMVSNELISKILSCDGMIVIEEGNSATSPWVAFERDYALRTKKPVYAFRPSCNQLIRLYQQPLDLNIFPFNVKADQHRVYEIKQILNQRFFNLKPPIKRHESFPPHEKEMQYVIDRGGYCIFFWSSAYANSFNLPTTKKTVGSYGPPERGTLVYSRILFALLDDAPLPSWFKNDNKVSSISLYPSEDRTSIHKVDDLIVNLYWLIFRNQFPELIF